MVTLTNTNDTRIGFYLYQQAWSETYSGANTFDIRDLYFPGIW
jgi:hypothetical protein